MKRVGITGGKGGTGKTTIAVSLTKYVSNSALLDLDLTMPNVSVAVPPKERDVVLENGVIQPVRKEGREYFSIGYLCDETDVLTWDSKRVSALVDEIFKVVKWDNPEYLFIDCPPGSDAVFQAVLQRLDTIIVVTQPTKMSYLDAKKIVELAMEESVGISGEIRNFTSFTCPECGYTSRIFTDFTDALDIPLLCEIPIVKLDDGVIPRRFIDVNRIIEAINNPIVRRRRERREIIKELLGLTTRRG